MKSKAILIFAAMFVMVNLNAFGQSSFLLRNRHGSVVDAPVYDAAGIPLAGPSYRAELWGSATPDSLTPLLVLDEGLRREIVPFQTDGYFNSDSGFLSVINVGPGAFAWVQVRAWDARLGATWEDVAALGLGGYGESSLLYLDGGDPTANPPTSAARLIGLQSFNLRPVPEPSTWLIAALGLTGMWLFVRRKTR